MRSRLLALVLCTSLSLLPRLGVAAPSGQSLEVFAKGSVSKNYLAADKWTLTVSVATGLAIVLIPQIRLEARYTSIGSLQNRLDIVSTNVTAILNDIKTQTTIYSLGLDISILSDKHAFQPFIYVGAGYIVTERSYYVRPDEATTATLETEPQRTGVSGNLGAGFRVHFARSAAIEIEAFAYGIDIHKPNPLVNLYGTAGIRLFF